MITLAMTQMDKVFMDMMDMIYKLYKIYYEPMKLIILNFDYFQNEMVLN